LNKQIGGELTGATWHHTEIPGKMELTPFGTHNIKWHLGGRSKGNWAEGKR
jgi:toxin YxiD